MRRERAVFVRVIHNDASARGEFLADVVGGAVRHPQGDPGIVGELDNQLPGRSIDAHDLALGDMQAAVADTIDFNRSFFGIRVDVMDDDMGAFIEPMEGVGFGGSPVNGRVIRQMYEMRQAISRLDHCGVGDRVELVDRAVEPNRADDSLRLRLGRRLLGTR